MQGIPESPPSPERLLEYWTDSEEFESRRFFFCQLEAAETLIWLDRSRWIAKRWGWTYQAMAGSSGACAPKWPPERARPSSWL